MNDNARNASGNGSTGNAETGADARKLEKLLLISQELTATTALGDLYRKATALAMELLQLDFSTLMILTEDHRQLIIRDTVGGFPESMINTFTLVEGQGLSTDVIRTKRAGTVPDFLSETRFEVPPVVFDKNIRSALCVPMMLGEEVFGVLIGHTREVRSFSEDEITLYQTIGNQAAVAIKHAMGLEAIRASEERYRTLVENIDYGVSLIDGGHRVVMANAAIGRMLGRDPEQIVGCECFREFERREAVCDHCPGVRAMATGLPAEVETEGVREDGTAISVRIRAFPVPGPNGTPGGFIEVVEDITERKTIEKERKELREQLLQSQKLESIGRLAGGIAHDFNNLLSSIIGYSELALLSISPGAPYRNYIETVRNSGERAATVARRLLALSRKQVLEMKVINLNTVVSQVVHLLANMIGEDIEITTRLSGKGRNVSADPSQMEQIIMNLCVNARDAMPKGGRLIIETSDVDIDDHYTRTHAGMRAGSYVMLAVTDTGEGMSREIREKIFDPFFTTKDVGKGTGLGLAMVHGIVQQHGGQVFVYSEVGRGTTFKIYLPATGEAAETLPAVPERRMRGGTEVLLVVEDEPSIRDLVVDTLDPLGYRLFGAASAGEAIQIVEALHGKIDLLLTDVVMPGGMNGRELADRIRSRYPGTTVVFMSGYTENVIVHHGIVDPGIFFLPKPLTPTALVSKVREALDARAEE